MFPRTLLFPFGLDLLGAVLRLLLDLLSGFSERHVDLTRSPFLQLVQLVYALPPLVVVAFLNKNHERVFVIFAFRDKPQVRSIRSTNFEQNHTTESKLFSQKNSTHFAAHTPRRQR